MKKIILLAAFGVAGLVSAKNGENLSLETKTTKEISVSKKIEIKKSTFSLDPSFELGDTEMKCYDKKPGGGTVEVKCPDVIIIVKP